MTSRTILSLLRLMLMLCFSGVAAMAAPGAPARDSAGRPRLIVLTDIGGDPDDQQAMVRLMTFASEFEIEGLIASASGTPGELKKDLVQPQLIRQIVEAYGQVRPNLALHREGYPAAADLLSRIKSGNPQRGVGQLGERGDTEGSQWIIRVVDRADPRPVNVTIWGGSTDLAQALWRVRHDRTPVELKAFLGRLRVYAIAHQDDTGPWIIKNFPSLFYILGNPPPGRDKREAVFRGMYLGGDEALTSRAWIDTHVRTGHGPLGALYPPKTWTAPNPHGALKEGDTPSWLYFLPSGLGDPAHPEWGGWGGRFRHAAGGLYVDAEDRVAMATPSARATVWRWRPAFQAEFQARLDWCVKAPAEANHPPLTALDGSVGRDVIRRSAKAGEQVRLSAAGSSDPDGNALAYRWWVYPEAGNYNGAAPIENPSSSEAWLTVPSASRNHQIHVILEVTDNGVPPLTAYRRVILDVARD